MEREIHRAKAACSQCLITTDEATMEFACNPVCGRNHHPAAYRGYRRRLNLFAVHEKSDPHGHSTRIRPSPLNWLITFALHRVTGRPKSELRTMQALGSLRDSSGLTSFALNTLRPRAPPQSRKIRCKPRVGGLSRVKT